MKIFYKTIIILTIMITIIAPKVAFAAPDSGGGTSDGYVVPSIGEIIDSGNNFIIEGQGQQDSTIKMENVNKVVNFLYAVAVGIGLLIATIVGILLGAKFMLSASSEEKAKYKQQLIAYLVGVAVIAGAFGIWKIVVNTLNTTTPDEAVAPPTATASASPSP